MKITPSLNARKISATRPKTLLAISKSLVARTSSPIGIPSFLNIKDKIYATYDSIQTFYDYSLSPVIINNDNNNVISWSSDNNNIATVNDNGYVSHLSDGLCNITVNVNNQSVSIPIITKTITEVKTSFYSYASNSLAKHIWDTINTKLIDKSPTTSKNLFISQDHTNNIYIRNTNNLLNSVDLSCISPWNSSGGTFMAGVLISPRHVIFCQHFGFYPSINSTIRFVKSNNQVISRTITNILPVNPNNAYPDIMIGVLNSDITDINFAKILPSSWSSYLPSLGGNASSYDIYDSLPAIFTDQEEKTLIGHCYRITLTSVGYQFSLVEPAIETHKAFYEVPVRFDSGNPVMLIINNEPVILGVFTTPNTGGFVSGHISEINTIMNQLGGGYSLTTIDLSSFSTY